MQLQSYRYKRTLPSYRRWRPVNYTVLGAITDKSESPEYLRVEVTPEAMNLDWHRPKI